MYGIFRAEQGLYPFKDHFLIWCQWIRFDRDMNSQRNISRWDCPYVKIMGSLNALNLAYIFIYIRYTQMVWCPYKKSYKRWYITSYLPSIWRRYPDLWRWSKLSQSQKTVMCKLIHDSPFSLYQMRADATRTPIDWIKSPMTCMNAALKLISSDKCSSTAKLIIFSNYFVKMVLLSCVWTWKWCPWFPCCNENANL